MITDPPPMPTPAIVSALMGPTLVAGSAAGPSGSRRADGRTPGSPASSSASTVLAPASPLSASPAMHHPQGSTAQPGPGPGGAHDISGDGRVGRNSASAEPGEPCHAFGPAPAAAPPAAGAAVAHSLQDCCCKVIQRHLSVHNCLELLMVASGREAPALAALAAASLRYAVNSFETLQGLRSEEQMREALSSEVYDNLVSAHHERLQALADVRLVGRVVERAEAAVAASEVPSAAGWPVSYPPEALLASVSWPLGVDGSAREEWLAADDFSRLFGGLSWEEFRSLPGWRKTRLKQAAGLF